jgi:glycosyltransferase involved in cell wall biosynthesis
MIEAMACGTPVIAFRNGSVPEIIDDGVTGFVVNDVDEAVEATRRARTLDRRLCRRTFEERFSVARMTNDYLRLYDRLIERDYPTSVRRSAVRRSAA